MPPSASSYMALGSYGTSCWVDPQEGIVALLMTPIASPNSHGEIHDKFRMLVYQALSDLPVKALAEKK